MHYTIERTLKDEPFGEILESNRRAGNDAGKAQAYALARSLGKKHPDCTIFVNEVLNRDDENIIAVVNANGDVKERLPEIEYLDLKRHQKLVDLFRKTISDEMKKGASQEEARTSVTNLLTEVVL